MRKWPAPLSVGVQRRDSGVSPPETVSSLLCLTESFLPVHWAPQTCHPGFGFTEELWLRARPSLSLPPSQKECQAVALGFWPLNKPKANLPIWERDPHQQKGLGLTASRGEERGFKKALVLRSWPPARNRPSIPPSIQHPRFPCKWKGIFHLPHLPARSELAETMQFSPQGLGPLFTEMRLCKMLGKESSATYAVSGCGDLKGSEGSNYLPSQCVPPFSGLGDDPQKATSKSITLESMKCDLIGKSLGL